MKYCPAPDLVSSAFFFENAFVDVALGIGAEHHPLDAIDHFDEARKLGGIGDLVLRLGENLAQHSLACAEFAQGFHVVDFQFSTLERFQRSPVAGRRDTDIAVVGRSAVFIGHLEENEKCELLQIVAVADAVIAEGVAEAPDFGDDGFGGHGEEEEIGRIGRI